jgi:hypothetical protein
MRQLKSGFFFAKLKGLSGEYRDLPGFSRLYR